MKRGNSRILSIFYVKDLFNSAISKHYGFNYHELVALDYIKSKGSVSQSMLVKRLRMDKSSVTKLINKLVSSELVKKDYDPSDLRYRVLMPTEKLLTATLPKASFTDVFFDHIMQDATKDELDVFYRVTARAYNRSKEQHKNHFAELILKIAEIDADTSEQSE